MSDMNNGLPEGVVPISVAIAELMEAMLLGSDVPTTNTVAIEDRGQFQVRKMNTCKKRGSANLQTHDTPQS